MTEQEKREKVIKGMEYCLNYAKRVQDIMNDVPCEGCPYVELKSKIPGTGDCLDTMHNDAIELLKEQEPRVMTLEEAQNALHNDIVVWLEVKSEIYAGLFCGIRMDGTDYFTMQNDDVLSVTDLDAGKNAELYGKGIRCWTARPTDANRKVTPWHD